VSLTCLGADSGQKTRFFLQEGSSYRFTRRQWKVNAKMEIQYKFAMNIFGNNAMLCYYNFIRYIRHCIESCIDCYLKNNHTKNEAEEG